MRRWRRGGQRIVATTSTVGFEWVSLRSWNLARTRWSGASHLSPWLVRESIVGAEPGPPNKLVNTTLCHGWAAQPLTNCGIVQAMKRALHNGRDYFSNVCRQLVPSI